MPRFCSVISLLLLLFAVVAERVAPVSAADAADASNGETQSFLRKRPLETSLIIDWREVERRDEMMAELIILGFFP